MAIPPENQCIDFEFTCPVHACPNWKDLSTKLSVICDKFVFQKENSENGYLHYQGRMHLGTKRNGSQLKRELNVLNLEQLSFRVTATENRSKDFYATKLDTRVEGPWRDTDVPLYIPRQIKEIELRPWQDHIVKDAELWDTRTINVVYCPNGNVGKSTLVTYLGVNQIGRALPSIDSYKDVMQAVLSGGDVMKTKLYLIDMPRAINQSKMAGIYAAIEEIKSGHAWDTRHAYKEKFFDCPNIWVFCNVLPNRAFLSEDRWKIWTINADDELQSYTE